MTTQQSPNLARSAYRDTVRGLLRLHQYVVEKQDDTAGYHDLCAAMEGEWAQMTNRERERAGGLSQDLYTVSDPAPTELEPMTAIAHGELREMYEAREKGESDLALTVLRKLDKILPPPLIAYLRGRIWSDLGEARVALIFHERAYQLAPENPPFLSTFINALKEADLPRALVISEPIIRESERYDGNVVVQAVEAISQDVMERPFNEVTGTIRRLVDVLRRLVARPMKASPAIEGPYPYLALALLASFYRMLGELRPAYDCYSQLIAMDPRNEALLVSRGTLMYGSNSSAIGDFEQALKLDTKIVWPYYYLAHYLLSQGRFGACWDMCLRGLEKRAPVRIRSQLYEFMAIAEAGLGHAPDMVQRAFEAARQVDPENDRAGENLRRYLLGVVATKTKSVEWEVPTSSSIEHPSDRMILGGTETRRVPAGAY